MSKDKNLVPIVVIASMFFYLGHWCYNLWQTAEGISINEKFNWINTHINNYTAIYSLDGRFSLYSISCGLALFLIVLIIYGSTRDTGVYRHGEEYGSARFATLKEYAPYSDPDFFQNIILSMDIRLTYNRAKKFIHDRNKIVVVIGGSGSGKSYSILLPNLMQMQGSYLVIDPKGVLAHTTGKMFLDAGYKVRVFDLLSLSNSHKFNPFKYINTDAELRSMIEGVIYGTNEANAKSDQPFWSMSEKQVLTALLGYLHYSREEGMPYATLEDVTKLTPYLNDKYDQPEEPGVLDILFEELEEKISSNNLAIQSWKSFNANFQGETRINVTSMPTTRFQVFSTPEVAALTSSDDMDIEKWGTEKYVVFVKIPVFEKTYNFLANILVRQVLNTLVKVADKDHRGQLPNQVNLLLDEFASVGKLPNMKEAFTNLRSYRIFITTFIQEIAGISEELYKSEYKSMISNADSFVYLGGNSPDDWKYISKDLMGTQTITLKNHSNSRGQSSSSSESVQRLGRSLMTPDEIGVLPNDESLVRIRGLRFYRGKKYDLTQHPRFNQISESDPSKWWDYQINEDSQDDLLSSINLDDIEEIDLSKQPA